MNYVVVVIAMQNLMRWNLIKNTKEKKKKKQKKKQIWECRQEENNNKKQLNYFAFNLALLLYGTQPKSKKTIFSPF